MAAATASSAAGAAASAARSSTAQSLSQKLIHNKGVRLVAGGWGLFIAENLILSENRTWIIENYSQKLYHTAYNTLSTISCCCIAYGYMRHGRRQGPHLWNVTRGMRMASLGLTGFGLLGFANALPTLRSPLQFLSGIADKIKGTQKEGGMKNLCPLDFEAERDLIHDGPYGLERISRHGTLWSFGALSLGCMLRTKFASEVVFFAFPAITVIILGSHIDSRYRRGIGGEIVYEWPLTSHFPFAAMIIGGTGGFYDLLNELKPVNTGLSMGALGLFAVTHFRK